MKKNVVFYFLLIIGCIITVSCQKTNDIDFLEDEQLSISSAQKWFKKMSNPPNSRISNKENFRYLDWAKADYYTFPFGKSVIIPINYQQSYSLYYSGSQKQQNPNKIPPKYKITNSDLDYLIIYKDNDGNFKEKVYRIIPDESYLEQSNGRKKKIAYEGFIIINDWHGNLIEGYKYVKGKAVAKINSQKQLRAYDFECETIDWWSCGSGDGGNTWYCSYSYSEAYCYNVGSPPNEDYPNPDFPNVGGDGSSGGNGGGITFTNALPPGQKPLQIHPSKCAGAQALWTLSQQTNKEVTGVITMDGNYLITQVQGASGGVFSGLIRHDNQLYYYYPANNDPLPPFQGTLAGSLNGVYNYYIPISATVHSHTPCLQDGTDGLSHPVGNDDIQLAQTYPMAIHWVIGCNAIGQFNGQNPNFFNKHFGQISQTCSSF